MYAVGYKRRLNKENDMVTSEHYTIRDSYTFFIRYSVFASAAKVNDTLRSCHLGKLALSLCTEHTPSVGDGVTCYFEPSTEGLTASEVESLLHEALVKRLRQRGTTLDLGDYTKSLVFFHEDDITGSRTFVVDYVIDYLGVYVPVSSRWVKTHHTEHDADKHWTKVREAVPFDLDILTFRGKGDHVDPAQYRFDVTRYSTVIPSKPVEYESQILKVKVDYDETAWAALRGVMRFVVENNNVLPSFMLGVKALEALLNNR